MDWVAADSLELGGYGGGAGVGGQGAASALVVGVAHVGVDPCDLCGWGLVGWLPLHGRELSLWGGALDTGGFVVYPVGR